MKVRAQLQDRFEVNTRFSIRKLSRNISVRPRASSLILFKLLYHLQDLPRRSPIAYEPRIKSKTRHHP